MLYDGWLDYIVQKIARSTGEEIRLTERERQILEHLARGESNKAIARTLDISHDTVKLHVRHILSKLSLSSRVEAAVFAVQHKVTLAQVAR